MNALFRLETCLKERKQCYRHSSYDHHDTILQLVVSGGFIGTSLP